MHSAAQCLFMAMMVGYVKKRKITSSRHHHIALDVVELIGKEGAG
jgi:hypothetical protein